ncbi:MAG: hypothetical protein L3J66_08085 [Bacteroidales bacterium]|nr:hypothetical protein [Bacteroidales bacterium]
MGRFLMTVSFLFSLQLALAQTLRIDSTCRTITLDGDELFPSWSADGTKLLFQSNTNGNWDIYLYEFDVDTLLQLTSATSNEQHPVWMPDGKHLVFDSDREGGYYLYKMDVGPGEQSFLFRREIECRQAAFPPAKRLVYFSGFDRQNEKWAIYSYDFVSDNLNKLTHRKDDCSHPAVSPNGKHILYLKSASTYPFERMSVLNWYGNHVIEMDSVWAIDPAWGPNGLKIYFVSGNNRLQNEVFSLWKNGSHLERLTNDNLNVRTPAVSPDGSKMALAVMYENSFDIFIIPLSQE